MATRRNNIPVGPAILTQRWTSPAVYVCICIPTKWRRKVPRRPYREITMANAHLASLNARHAKLDESVSAETRRPMPDQVRLAQLKREKLKVKEEISRTH